MSAEEFLARVEGARPYKGGWMALCPSHDDRKKPSLSVRVLNGWITPHCFAGCTRDQILTALRLELRDLKVDDAAGDAPPPRGARRDRGGVGPSSATAWVTEAEYNYTDETGDLEFQVVRQVPADGSPDKKIWQRRPMPGHPDEWAMGLGAGWYTKGRDDRWRRDDKYEGGAEADPPTPGAVWLDEQRPLIYRMGDLWLGHPFKPWPGEGFAKRWLFVVEGEKKVDLLLTEFQYAATTCAQGAGKWKPEHADQLVVIGVKRVIVCPDNDAPGFRHMVDVAKTCQARKIEVLWLDLPGLNPKADVVDWAAFKDCVACRIK